MIYPLISDARRRRRGFSALVPAVGVILALIILSVWRPGLFGPVSLAVAKPIFAAREFVLARTAVPRAALIGAAELLAEREELRDRLALVEREREELRLIEAERDELLALVGRLPQRHRVVLARVLAKPPLSPYDTLLLDVGAREGVAVGMTVVVQPNIPVGAVAAVYGANSLVELFSAPGRELPVVLERGAIAATATGRGGGNFDIRIPRGLGAASGDPVFLSPGTPDRLLGTIEALSGGEADPFVTAFVKAPVNLFELRFVEVRLSP